MIAGPSWVQHLLLLLAVVAVVLGLFELVQLLRRRRRTLPGYGWETEVAHLVMNALMAAMATPFWSASVARGGGVALGLAAVLLAIVPMLRPPPPRAEHFVAAVAAVIHVGAALLMAWLLGRMAPASGHATMMMGHPARPWFAWPAAGFFLFDLASVLVVTTFPHRFSTRFDSGAPRLSIFPHVAMDIGMIAMLVGTP